MKLFVLLSLISCVSSKNVFVSSPFDNFRIECPKRAAATELSIRMVESVGQKRQDIVFDMSCETVDDLYPWINIPVGISEIEREDCHYSDMIDPILDEDTIYTCDNREYLAGITRLSDTRIQTMCCRLRSRDEFNCKEMTFNKPIGLTRSTVIENDGQLINALKIVGRNYVVRFCDLAPRSTAGIMADEKIRSVAAPTTTTTTTEEPEVSQEISEPQQPLTIFPAQHKQDPLKYVKPNKLGDNLPRIESAPIEHIDRQPVPLVPLADTKQDQDIGVLPVFKEVKSTRPVPATLATVTTPSTTRTTPVTTTTTSTTTTTTTTTEQPTTESTTEALPTEETTFPQETPIFNQKLVEDIVRKIGSAQSEEKAAQIFQKSLNKLIQKSNKQEETVPEAPALEPIPPVITEEKLVPMKASNGPPAARPPVEEADDENISAPHARRFSKDLLPLRRDLNNEFGTLNSEGRRRAPMRAHRPHVKDWSSSEETDYDEETQQIVSEINGSVKMRETAPKSPRKVVKKIIKKVIRGRRTTTEPTTTTMEFPSTRFVKKRKPLKPTVTTTTTQEPITEPIRQRTRQYTSSFFSSIEDMKRESFEDMDVTQKIRSERTTTPSARRDLPARRRAVESHTNQADNARDVDEDTRLSPFDNPSELADMFTVTDMPVLIQKKKTTTEAPKVEFQEDEELEDVISKLTVRREDIRRSPVRNSIAAAQFAEKVHLPENNNKDGVKTHRPNHGIPLQLPGMDSISTMNLEEFDEMPQKSKSDDKRPQQKKKHENKAMMENHTNVHDEPVEQIDDEAVVTTPVTIVTTTTPYDPNNFYRTPRPKPAKKESILRFCSKELAIRDQSNMVIACGIDQEIWSPTRCPENADCFMSHDSLYRICCPVHRG